MATLADLAKEMSEKQLDAHVRQIINDLGLATLAFHPPDGVSPKCPNCGATRKRANGRYRRGYPDWTILGPRGLLFRELKRQDKKPDLYQQAWLEGLRSRGCDADVWRPEDLHSGRIARELGAIAGFTRKAG